MDMVIEIATKPDKALTLTNIKRYMFQIDGVDVEVDDVIKASEKNTSDMKNVT